MIGFNPGALVQGHQAGVSVATAQEELKMKKANFYQQHQMNEQSIQANDYALQKAERAEQSAKRIESDMQRMNLVKGISNAVKAKDFDATKDVLEELNILDLPIFKGEQLTPLQSSNDEDIDKAISYLDKSGKLDQFNIQPYILGEDGKPKQPNTLDQAEMLQAYENAQEMRKTLALELMNKGHLITNTKGDVLGLDDLGAVIGLGKRPQFNQNVDLVYSGLSELLASKQKGAGAQSTFGKFTADMQAMGVSDMDTITKLYHDVEKEPIVGKAIAKLKEDGKPLTTENIDEYVRAFKGTSKSDKGSGETTAPIAYDSMINSVTNALGKPVSNMSGRDVFAEVSKLPAESQGRLKAYAKEYFKESKEKLMDPIVLSKHLHTLKTLDMTDQEVLDSVQSAAGLSDVATNSIKKYFATDEGIEFTRTFKQSFNNLLSTSGKGHISKAELDNLQDAFGSLSASNEVVFNNFKSMITSMSKQLEAYESTSPIAANILYGKEIDTYNLVLDALNRASGDTRQTTVNIDGVDTKITSDTDNVKVGDKTFNFSGGE